MTKFYFKADFDNQKIYYFKWTNVKNPQGIVHIVHGTNEYLERYDDLAKAFNKAGFIVYGMDIRGHGQTGKTSQYGFFAPKNGHRAVYQDIKQMHKIIRKENTDLPLTLMGHSLGSFIVRGYANYYYDIDKLIIMGTNHKSQKAISALKFISRLQKLGNPRKPGKFIAKLSYDALNKKFPNQHKYAWISYNKANLEEHMHPLHPKFILTNTAFYDLARWMQDYKKVKLLAKHNKPLKILVVSGQDDPVSNEGADIQKLKELFDKYKLKNKVIIYPKMRHEIIHEDNKKQVYEDLITFIKK